LFIIKSSLTGTGYTTTSTKPNVYYGIGIKVSALNFANKLKAERVESKSDLQRPKIIETIGR